MAAEREHLRISSPLSSSPGRTPVFSRPAWPWTRYNQSRPPSVHSSSGSLSGQRASGSWDASRLSSSVSTTPTAMSTNQLYRHSATSSTQWNRSSNTRTGAESHRQWTFTGFEWTIRDVTRLKEWVETPETVQDDSETSPALTEDNFEILRESPVLGDDKFKLEVARTHIESDSSSTQGQGRDSPLTLSLYITAMMDFSQADYEIPASIMVAIKCQDDRSGERGSRPDWVWQIWHNDWNFRQESEVWECSLPPLSALLENDRIRETDSLVICIQLHSPVGPFFPQHPSAYYVPRDLLDGLEASLDNANTGDVRFICLEKMDPGLIASPAASDTASGLSQSASSHIYQTTARKRCIYAHSDILIRRSEHFTTMLGSSFLEAQTTTPGERKVYTVVVEEADFESIYWLLKYCYANWVLFKERDDPRAAVEGIAAGWNSKWVNLRGDEWDWKTFSKTIDSEDSITGDTRSIASGGSRRSNDEVNPSLAKSLQTSTSGGGNSASTRNISTSKPSTNTNPSNRQSTSTSTSTPRRTGPTTSTPTGLGISSSNMRPKTVPIPISSPTSNYPAGAHYPISPRSQRNHSSPDPHPHPTLPPAPASALSMYQLAHRYSMPALVSLSLEHMMSTITPQSSFALLLATSIWEDLHTLVEDYVVEKWDEVSVSEEFEKCCAEVAGGEWGSEGGKTLMALFRRLRSPGSIPYTRAG
ncbi:hypothetical protein EYR40_005151 [Pleurotus pulmonarius]|nr:hypothetical protein EYR40_005151 [Pleurotus pulmonarius]